ncbi:MAG: DNA/RNA non-specific endonuclease [Bacteroidaceae bacterium]|nr:DNA/RNA non-specific endonuclease [Bacteroidaceae bacterium]
MLNRSPRHLLLLLPLCALLALTACNEPEDLTPDEELLINHNQNPAIKYARRLEMPALDRTNTLLTHSTYYRGKETLTYSIEYDENMHHSKWVAFTFYDVVNERNWSRSNWYSTSWGGDPFQKDPSLSDAVCPDRSFFGGSGGVRGHLCASADRLYSKEANEQTFYYSNMSPMNYDFNGGFWADLEIALRDAWAYKSTFCDTLYVVKGGTIREGEYRKSNNGKLPIPNHYFMALLCRKNGTYKSIGFWVEHKAQLNKIFRDCAVSIDKLEELTGIDFFCNLPDKIEESVEVSYYPSVWGLN